MSLDSARAFLARMNTDANFAKSFRNAKDRENRAKLAQAAGFHFTRAELNEARGAMDESDLEKVTGGSGCDDIIWQEHKQAPTMCQDLCP